MTFTVTPVRLCGAYSVRKRLQGTLGSYGSRPAYAASRARPSGRPLATAAPSPTAGSARGVCGRAPRGLDGRARAAHRRRRRRDVDHRHPRDDVPAPLPRLKPVLQTLAAYRSVMVLRSAATRVLGVERDARIRFGEEEKAEGAWLGRRMLFLDDRPAFDLSYWCGTCQLLFKRQEGAHRDGVARRGSRTALPRVSTVWTRRSSRRSHRSCQWASTCPCSFASLRAWSIRCSRATTRGRAGRPARGGWSLTGSCRCNPGTPRSPDVRDRVDAEAHLFEFIVPMVPPAWNDTARVAEHRERLQSSQRPTAVAATIFDVGAPAVEVGADILHDWGLTLFLPDGDHKLQAAAESGSALQLLSRPPLTKPCVRRAGGADPGTREPCAHGPIGSAQPLAI